MEDAELEAIRQTRLRELQARAGGPSVGHNVGNAKSSEEETEQKRQQEETRQNLLIQILDNEARER
ncbi:12174_t:CDS:2, partial [Ambispora gerdemannii]